MIHAQGNPARASNPTGVSIVASGGAQDGQAGIYESSNNVVLGDMATAEGLTLSTIFIVSGLGASADGLTMAIIYQV